MIDDGCGGTPYVLDLVQKMMEGGRVPHGGGGGLAPSPRRCVNREVYTDELETGAGGARRCNAYLSMYVFGDGAGAVMLRGEDGRGAQPGIVASLSGNAHERAGDPPRRRRAEAAAIRAAASPGDQAFVVDGFKVARSYPQYMRAVHRRGPR